MPLSTRVQDRAITGGNLEPVVIARIMDGVNINADLQVGGADISDANPVPVSDAGGSLTVDQATHDFLNANVNLQVGDEDVDEINPVPVTSVPGTYDAVLEHGLQEVIGYNQNVTLLEYSDSFMTAFGSVTSGTLVQFSFYTDEIGTGAILTPAGTFYIFDADPGLNAGDTDMASIAVWGSVIGKVDVAAADWTADANGAMACIKDQPIVFHPLSEIYTAWFHEDAVPFNNLAGNDERLRWNMWSLRSSAA